MRRDRTGGRRRRRDHGQRHRPGGRHGGAGVTVVDVSAGGARAAADADRAQPRPVRVGRETDPRGRRRRPGADHHLDRSGRLGGGRPTTPSRRSSRTSRSRAESSRRSTGAPRERDDRVEHLAVLDLDAGDRTKRPERVIGSHWFNPPPMMDLIEIIRGVETSDETLATTLTLAERYGKRPSSVTRTRRASSPRG